MACEGVAADLLTLSEGCIHMYFVCGIPAPAFRGASLANCSSDPEEEQRQDMADPCEGEPEPAKAKQLTICPIPTLCPYPSFVKSIRTSTMRSRSRDFRLEIPAIFVKEHGHRFQATVALQGPSGRLMHVRLRIRSCSVQNRVQFAGAEWRAFVLENKFQVGDQQLFSLISMSTFEVRPLDSTAPNNRTIQIPTDVKSSTCHGGGFPPNVPEMITEGPSGEDLAMMKNVDIVYGNVTSSLVKEEVDRLVGNLECPHFVTKIGESSIREYHSTGGSALSVPQKFFDKYAEYFSKTVNVFQGPSGSIVELWFSGPGHPRFTTGWKAFRKENDICMGDVLLFSLRAPACWLVQVVQSHSGEELCNTAPHQI